MSLHQFTFPPKTGMLQEPLLTIAVCFYKPGENCREEKYLLLAWNRACILLFPHYFSSISFSSVLFPIQFALLLKVTELKWQLHLSQRRCRSGLAGKGRVNRIGMIFLFCSSGWGPQSRPGEETDGGGHYMLPAKHNPSTAGSPHKRLGAGIALRGWVGCGFSGSFLTLWAEFC